MSLPPFPPVLWNVGGVECVSIFVPVFYILSSWLNFKYFTCFAKMITHFKKYIKHEHHPQFLYVWVRLWEYLHKSLVKDSDLLCIFNFIFILFYFLAIWKQMQAALPFDGRSWMRGLQVKSAFSIRDLPGTDLCWAGTRQFSPCFTARDTFRASKVLRDTLCKAHWLPSTHM